MVEVHKTRAKGALAIGKLKMTANASPGRSLPDSYSVICDYQAANGLPTHMALRLDREEARKLKRFLDEDSSL